MAINWLILYRLWLISYMNYLYTGCIEKNIKWFITWYMTDFGDASRKFLKLILNCANISFCSLLNPNMYLYVFFCATRYYFGSFYATHHLLVSSLPFCLYPLSFTPFFLTLIIIFSSCSLLPPLPNLSLSLSFCLTLYRSIESFMGFRYPECLSKQYFITRYSYVINYIYLISLSIFYV